VDTFEGNALEWEHLPDLDADALKELGVKAMDHRLTLLRAIRELHESEDGGTEAVNPDPVSGERAGLDPAGAVVTLATPEGTAERRQLTVTFCELMGSTALSDEMDPEDYRDVLVAYQSAAVGAIERFEGYVARYRGDGLLWLSASA
jgi:class 3 adenylate cyclase